MLRLPLLLLLLVVLILLLLLPLSCCRYRYVLLLLLLLSSHIMLAVATAVAVAVAPRGVQNQRCVNDPRQRDDGWKAASGDEQALMYTLEEISGSDYALHHDRGGGSQVRPATITDCCVRAVLHLESEPQYHWAS